MTIRTATLDDVGAVLDLWSSARSLAASTPDTPDALAALLDRDPEALLVAEEGDAIVGSVVAGFDGWRGNLYRLAVVPEHRRRGIATALVREAERRLRHRGARRITALVGADDDVAQALWRATGYLRDHAVARFVRNV